MSSLIPNMMVYSLVDFNSSGVIKEVGNTHITYTSNQTGECIKIQPNQVTNNPALIIRQLLQENEELRNNYHSANREIIKLRSENK